MRRLVLLGVVVLLAAGGVFVAVGSPSGDSAPPVAVVSASPSGSDSPEVQTSLRPAPRPVRASRCPAGLTRCRSVRGRVLYVESVDPDGDGDLHVVLTGGGVTGPGITSVDVAPALRPRRDPRVGDLVSAAGQVQRGSFGQSQVHAVEVHVRRAR